MASPSWILYFCWFPAVIICTRQVRGVAAGPSLSDVEAGGSKLLFHWSSRRVGATRSLMASDDFKNTHMQRRCRPRSANGSTCVAAMSCITLRIACLQLPLLWIIGLGDCGLQLCLWPPRRVALVPSVTHTGSQTQTHIYTPHPPTSSPPCLNPGLHCVCRNLSVSQTHQQTSCLPHYSFEVLMDKSQFNP